MFECEMQYFVKAQYNPKYLHIAYIGCGWMTVKLMGFLQGYFTGTGAIYWVMKIALNE